MKTKFTILITILVLTALTLNVFSQTEVNGIQSGTWAAENSPYLVIGEINIPSGQVLTIEPGVEINFQGHYKFTVFGNLQAHGSASDSVFFTTDNPAIGWGGIRFDGSDGISNLSYCRIEFGKSSGDYPDNLGGAIALLTADAVFSNCVFADNDASANDSGSGGAVYAINTGSTSGPLTTFTDCKFIRNHAYGEGGAVKFTSDFNTLFTNCEFFENTCNYGGGAISFYSVLDTKMVHCLFAGNSTLYSNGGAIHSLGFGNTFIFENCTITENSAENGDGGGVNLVFASATFINSIIYNNPGAYSDDIYLDMNGNAEINYSNLTMPDGAAGSNNINENPLFVDAANSDFHLSENSPCIDAGTDIGYPYNGDAPDMGSYEFEITTGIQDYSLADLSVFPNPTSGKITISPADNRIIRLTVSDLKGSVLIEELLNNSVDLSSLEKGVYLISIATDKGLLTTKVVKE